MKVLITGGGGFVGQNLYPRLYSLFEEENVFHPAKHVFDLRKQSECRSMVTYLKPDIVIHLAGTVGGISANKENPGKFMYDNLIMGANLIHECMKNRIGKFIMLGTVCSYPKFTPVPFKESDFFNFNLKQFTYLNL
jgi:nucleoside-diphosphate-sugar epimerase